MERRGYGFFTKRSQHYDNLQQATTNEPLQKQPLKDATNTSPTVKKEPKTNEEQNTEVSESQPNNSTATSNNNNQQPQSQNSRSLQCLETLAQKAGIHDITAEDCKYDIANTLLNLDRVHETFKTEYKQEYITSNMSDIKNQQQHQQQQQQQQQLCMLQIVDPSVQAQAQVQAAQAQAQAQAQVQAQAIQQQQQQQAAAIQQVTLQAQDQQTIVPAQSPHLQQVTVASSGAQCVQATPQQHAVHQQQVSQVLQTQGGQVLTPTQAGNTTITTMSPLQQGQQHPQQISATDWSHGRPVQVIQQPLQNPTYLQQLYNTSGQLLVPGNIALHPSINPQQIQVITKPFQGNQLAPHMITTAQGKQVLQASQAASFPGYTTIPTIPTTQNQQTLVFSQLGVISSQPNIIPTHSATVAGGAISQQKQQELHKVMGAQKVMQKVGTNGVTVAGTQQQGQCVQVSQAMIGSQPTAQIISPLQPGGQPMQFTTPWQFTNGIPQVYGLPSQTLLAPNSILIRGTQPDGTPGMYIQQSPQATAIQAQQNSAIATQATMQQIGKPRQPNENIQPKQVTSRPLNILPSNTASIRPANVISTQSIGTQAQSSLGAKPGTKVRAKAPGIRTSPAPKADAANQTQIKPYTSLQPHHLVNANKMNAASPMTVEKAQQLANQNKQMQVPQQQQQQQQAVLMQHQAIQQQQQQALQQLQFQQAQQPQQIQPKPIIGMQTIQGMQQQQLTERQVMPVVSMSAQPNAHQQQLQQIQQAIPGNVAQTIPLQQNLAVTQQPMQIGMSQLHSLAQMAPPGTIISQVQALPGTNTISPVTQMQQLQQGMTQTVTIPIQQSLQQAPTLTSIKEELITSATTDTCMSATSTQSDLMDEDGHKDSEMMENKTQLGLDQISVSQAMPIPGTVPSQQNNMNLTSDNGLPIAATAEDVKEKCPPKAMVKPQVLTHVIEDFVIQESSEPFPITRSSLLGELKSNATGGDKPDEASRKRRAESPISNLGLSAKGDLGKCEACGVVDLKIRFKKNKRFCSVICAKSPTPTKLDEKKGKWADNDGMEAESDKNDPSKWNVNEVYEFIKNLPGCSEYAEDFLAQEIDGQALMLIKEDHLMSVMTMKLGPALKIVAKIDDMRVDKEQPK